MVNLPKSSADTSPRAHTYHTLPNVSHSSA